MNGEPGPASQRRKQSLKLPLTLEGYHVTGFEQLDLIKLELKANTLGNQPRGIHQNGPGASA